MTSVLLFMIKWPVLFGETNLHHNQHSPIHKQMIINCFFQYIVTSTERLFIYLVFIVAKIHICFIKMSHICLWGKSKTFAAQMKDVADATIVVNSHKISQHLPTFPEVLNDQLAILLRGWLFYFDNVDRVTCGTPLLCVFKKRESARLHVFMGNNPVSAAPWTLQKTYVSLRSRGCPQDLSVGAVVHASQLMLLSADLSDERTCVFPVSLCFVALVVFLQISCWFPLYKAVNQALMSSKLWNKTFATTWL